MVRALWPPLSCSLVIVKRRHAGWHGAGDLQGCLDAVSVPELQGFGLPRLTAGVSESMSRVI